MPGIVPQSEQYGLPERESRTLPSSESMADVLRPTGIPSGMNTYKQAGRGDDYDPYALHDMEHKIRRQIRNPKPLTRKCEDCGSDYDFVKGHECPEDSGPRKYAVDATPSGGQGGMVPMTPGTADQVVGGHPDISVPSPPQGGPDVFGPWSTGGGFPGFDQSKGIPSNASPAIVGGGDSGRNAARGYEYKGPDHGRLGPVYRKDVRPGDPPYSAYDDDPDGAEDDEPFPQDPERYVSESQVSRHGSYADDLYQRGLDNPDTRSRFENGHWDRNTAESAPVDTGMTEKKNPKSPRTAASKKPFKAERFRRNDYVGSPIWGFRGMPPGAQVGDQFFIDHPLKDFSGYENEQPLQYTLGYDTRPRPEAPQGSFRAIDEYGCHDGYFD